MNSLQKISRKFLSGALSFFTIIPAQTAFGANSKTTIIQPENVSENQNRKDSQSSSTTRNILITVAGLASLCAINYCIKSAKNHEWHRAAKNGDINKFGQLNPNDPKDCAKLALLTADGFTPFYIAIKNKRFILADYLADNFIVPNIHCKHSKPYKTLCATWIMAAVRGDMDVLNYLCIREDLKTCINFYIPHQEDALDKYFRHTFGAGVATAFSKPDKTVLDYALEYGHIQAAELLIRNGARPVENFIIVSSDSSCDLKRKLKSLIILKNCRFDLPNHFSRLDPKYQKDILENALRCGDLFKFFIEECHALSNLNHIERSVIRSYIQSDYSDLLDYFDEKCRE